MLVSLQTFFQVCWPLGLIFIVTDFTMKFLMSYDSNVRWYILHTIGNLFITYYCLGDALMAFLDPLNALTGSFSLVPIILVVLMHVYHWVMFRLSLHDMIHHFIFVGIMGFIDLVYGFGPVSNLLIMFMSGLPGAMDYILLTLVELEFIESSIEKKINSYLNLYLRSPGTLFGVFLILINCLRTSNPPLVFSLLISLLSIINAQIYIEKTIIDRDNHLTL